MPKTRFLKITMFAVFMSAVVLAIPLTSHASSVVPSAEITGVPDNVSCTGGGNPLVPMIYNIPDPAAVVGTMVVNGVGTVSSFDQVTSGLVTTGPYGFAPSAFDVPSGTHITDTITTYNTADKADGVSYQCILVYECGTGTLVSLNCAEESVPEAEAPGCDATLAIPSGSAVGLFVADAPVLWEPSATATTGLTVAAGKTFWVTGQDASGQFRQIILQCKFVWVPFNAVAPNPDATWHNTPLPTTVIG